MLDTMAERTTRLAPPTPAGPGREISRAFQGPGRQTDSGSRKNRIAFAQKISTFCSAVRNRRQQWRRDHVKAFGGSTLTDGSDSTAAVITGHLAGTPRRV